MTTKMSIPEIVEQKLIEGGMWMDACRDFAASRRHPRQEEFLRRWVDLQARLDAVRIDLGRLAAEENGAGFRR